MKCKKCDGRGYYTIRKNLITMRGKNCEICRGSGELYIPGTLARVVKELNEATNEFDKRRLMKEVKKENELYTQHLSDDFGIEVY